MLQHQMWRLHLKTTYDFFFFSEYLCIWCFSQPTPSKKKGRTQFLWVSAACSAQRPALKSNNRGRNQQAWHWLFHSWRNITRSNIQGLYNLPCLLPWACDICQCPMLHLWSPRMVRGKAVTSPALNMSGMFVLMNCQAGKTPEGQPQTHWGHVIPNMLLNICILFRCLSSLKMNFFASSCMTAALRQTPRWEIQVIIIEME